MSTILQIKVKPKERVRGAVPPDPRAGQTAGGDGKPQSGLC